MSSALQLYDGSTYQEAVFPDSPQSRMAQRWLLPFWKEGAPHYIDNLNTTIMALVIDDLTLPVTCSENRYGNAYVCDPHTHYIAYAREELALLNQPWLEKSLALLIGGLGWLFRRSQINQVVMVNNWLVSTNLHPPLTGEQIQRITAFLTRRFPNSPILFRSLNETCNGPILKSLATEGYHPIGSRQIYLLAPSQPLRSKSMNILRRDQACFAKSGHQAEDLQEPTPDELERITDLYNQLYLEKYSHYNPAYSARLLALAIKEKLLHVKVLRKDGQINGVLGFFTCNGVMTTPLFGYDLNLPFDTGLYRMLSYLLIEESKKRNLLLHQSSGAADFKRCRGATADIEYSAVYLRHLPLWRRLPWLFLHGVVNRIGVPLMKKRRL